MLAPAPQAKPNEAGAIYGQILVTAVVATLSEEDDISAGETFAAVAVTMLVFWLAHVYAESVAKRLGRGEPLKVGEVWTIARYEWPIAQAAVPALLVLGIGSLGLLSRDASVAIAIGLGVAELLGWGFIIARRSGMSPLATLGSVAMNGAFGLAIVVLKVVVH